MLLDSQLREGRFFLFHYFVPQLPSKYNAFLKVGAQWTFVDLNWVKLSWVELNKIILDWIANRL